MIEWRKRKTSRGTSHAFRDGVPLCAMAAIPVGTVSRFQGRKVGGFEQADLSAWGRPYGRVCAWCEKAVSREERAS